MKNILNALFCLLISIILTFELKAQTNVPDVNFRTFLNSIHGITFDVSNNITNPETAASITVIDVSSKNISDLTGIELFTFLEQLNCSNNLLTELNISALTNLKVLYCYNNPLGSIDVSYNINLVTLYCDGNELTSLDVSNNTELETLGCTVNQLTSLDLSNNLKLKSLGCYSNQLSSLDLSANTSLEFLNCLNNKLSNLNVSNNPLLTFLDIRFNITPFILTVWTLPFPPAEGITFTDINPSSEKVLGSLPVELSSFTAQSNNGNVVLNWSTVTESNNAGWDVESRTLRQAQGDNSNFKNGHAEPVEAWTKVGFTPGKGTTTESQSYEFQVPSSEFKTSSLQFRLKQIDTDGKFTYSNILSVDVIPNNFGLSQNYPNPFNPSTAISYQLSAVSEVRLVVFDLLGREVATLVNEKKEAGKYVVNLNASSLTSGVYFYKLTAGSFSETKKMMLVK